MDTTLALVLLVALGAYVQTVTGFALGLIVMGAVTALGVAPIAFTAVVISVASLFNIIFALRTTWGYVDRGAVLQLGAGLVPGVIAGVYLLDYLSGTASAMLRMLLGTVILGGGIFLMLKPHPRNEPSSREADVAFGTIAGLLGGLFATAGPPVVYHLYRQPMSVAAVKATMMAVFGIATIMRNGVVLVRGEFTLEMLTTALWSVPVIYLATRLGQAWHPPFSDRGMRRLAFGLLALIGLALIVS